MYPKTKTLLLIKHYAPLFKKLLGIRSKRIKFKVYNPRSNEFKRDKDFHRSTYYDDEYGMTLVESKKPYFIYIFNVKHVSQEQVIGTIFHELLHVKYHELMKKGTALNLEEDFIRSIESCMLHLLFKGIK